MKGAAPSQPAIRLYPAAVLASAAGVWLVLAIGNGATPAQAAGDILAPFCVAVLGLGWVVTPSFFRRDSFAHAAREALMFVLLPLPLLALCYVLTRTEIAPIALTLVVLAVVMLVFGILVRTIAKKVHSPLVRQPLIALLQWLPPMAAAPGLFNQFNTISGI